MASIINENESSHMKLFPLLFVMGFKSVAVCGDVA